MTDPEMRDSGTLVSGFQRTEPIAPVIPVRLAVRAVEAKVTEAGAPPRGVAVSGAISAALPVPLFSPDTPWGPDAFGIETLTSLLAELAVHKNVELPLCIGVLGAPGSGKSFSLARLGASAAALAAEAKAGAASPYLAPLMTIEADAGLLDGEPAIALAAALYAGLAQAAPDLVEEALGAVRDPHAAVSEAAERLDLAQRRFHQERDNLTEVEGRRARLFDTLLYETPGSQVDAYARTQRQRIAKRLQAFGFSGDPVLNFKDLVASFAAAQGAGGRISMILRSLWAFKGQKRLLLISLILALLGAGLSWAVAHQPVWLASLSSAHESLSPLQAWIEDHMGAFAALGKAAFAGAFLAVLANFWRAFRFIQPVLRGTTLLKTEITNRQHELDSSYAHQTRRVDGLAAEVERAARAHAEADQRAGKASSRSGGLKEPPLFQTGSDKAKAQQFVMTIAALMMHKGQGAEAPRAWPGRILFLLDNLDAVPPARARDILNAVHRLFAQPVFVTAIAADPQRLAEGGNALSAQLEKWVQIPLRVDAWKQDWAAFARQLAGAKILEAGGAGTPPVEIAGAGRSSLDAALSEDEAKLLSALAPLAGRSARSLKRFVNLYRLTRVLLPDHRAPLAFMLALDIGGTQAEIEAINAALAAAKPDDDLNLFDGSALLNEALGAVRGVEAPLKYNAAKQAAQIASAFSFRM